MKKILFLAFIFCLPLARSFAQLGVGLRGGYGGSSTSQELVNGMKRSLGFSPTFGLMLNYNLDLHFSAGMEFNYLELSEGLEYDTNFVPGTAGRRLGPVEAVKTVPKIGYLQIPFFGRVTFGDKKYKAFLTFGPYIGIGLKGSWTKGPRPVAKGSFILMDSTYQNVKFETGDFRKLDLGGIVGFGGQYDIGKNGVLFIEARLQLGFLDFYNKRTKEQTAGFTAPTEVNKYLTPSGSWRNANVTIGYFHTFKLPKKKTSNTVKKAGKQRR
jgi:hypothetical protein